MAITYKAKDLVYKTVQSEMWDMIALREYGDEHVMNWIQDANFDQRFTDEFPGDVILQLPQSVTVQYNVKAQKPIPDLKELLPWR
jgi:hypothetical protein